MCRREWCRLFFVSLAGSLAGVVWQEVGEGLTRVGWTLRRALVYITLMARRRLLYTIVFVRLLLLIDRLREREGGRLGRGGGGVGVTPLSTAAPPSFGCASMDVVGSFRRCRYHDWYDYRYHCRYRYGYRSCYLVHFLLLLPIRGITGDHS